MGKVGDWNDIVEQIKHMGMGVCINQRRLHLLGTVFSDWYANPGVCLNLFGYSKFLYTFCTIWIIVVNIFSPLKKSLISISLLQTANSSPSDRWLCVSAYASLCFTKACLYSYL